MRFRARRLRVGIGTLAVALILIAVWAALRHHTRLPVAAPISSLVSGQALDGRMAARSTTAPKFSGLWVRPPAEVASRNHRRSGFAWILRQLGATESQLDRLTGGDAVGLVKELKEKAQAGDPTSILILGQLAFVNCRLGRSLGAYKLRQITEAQALPAADRDWFTSTLNDDLAFDTQLHSVCDQLIDTNEVNSWVKARAAQGDGASLWLLTEFSTEAVDRTQRLREAAAAGFAPAQFDLALLIDGGDEGAAGAGANEVQSLDLLNQAASTIPASKAELAICEYFGECPGIAVDIDAAIVHAREAAQAGDTNALLRIGPHLPPGQMDPNEVAAWGLIDASLNQQGCGVALLTVRQMQNITGTLSAKTIMPEARALAEQYWGDYGTQIMVNLGCGS
jgi:TPR repeat protein